ncbi:MAG: SulP family inorganic anion transporter [Bacteriovoracaceae bacterium]|nr:SulP family inorganic anion transporter [Bacteriovoracaceae bacterium]
MKVLDFKDDIKSSLVVFLVALPLCLGIALASNAPLASGLIAGIIGGIVVGLISGSHVSVSGPAAGLTVIVVNGIAQLGGFDTFGLAVLAAGLFQVLFGLIRGGAIGDYFPTAVIKGMLAAIGLILIIKQFPNAFSREVMGINIISIVSLAIILGWEKLPFKLVPGPLIAVVVSVVLNELFHLVEAPYLVNLPPDVFSGLMLPNFGNFNMDVLAVAFTIAVVASLETLLCIDAGDKLDPKKRKTSKNRELLAQGLGNALSGLVGGLPITAVIVRTSTNISAGAKTKMSAVFHGMWLLLCVLFIPGVLNLIPLATLACVLLTVGYKLTKPSLVMEMKERGWDQLAVFLTTIAAILVTDLLKGIFIGLALAIIFELRKPALSCLEVEEEDDKVHVKFIRNVSFLHKAKIHKILSDIAHDKQVHFHGLKNVRVHVDVHELITEYHSQAMKKGRKVSLG